MKTSTIYLVLLMVGLYLLSGSCNNRKSPEPTTHPSQNTETGMGTENNPSGVITVADQVIYDVEIINPNPNDQWTSECLSSLDHEVLVNFVFDGLYSERFLAFDIFDGTSISTKTIRIMEENGDFSRELIGKFQFKEIWVLDTLNMSYSKKVMEIRMGTQVFQDDSTVSGYEPLLRVVL